MQVQTPLYGNLEQQTYYKNYIYTCLRRSDTGTSNGVAPFQTASSSEGPHTYIHGKYAGSMSYDRYTETSIHLPIRRNINRDTEKMCVTDHYQKHVWRIRNFRSWYGVIYPVSCLQGTSSAILDQDHSRLCFPISWCSRQVWACRRVRRSRSPFPSSSFQEHPRRHRIRSVQATDSSSSGFEECPKT